MRLADSVGFELIGKEVEISAPERGWLQLPVTSTTLAQDDVLFVLQHSQNLQAVDVIMGFVGNGLRVRLNARTLPGASGSPCFNANLELVALHQAGEPNSRLDYKGAYSKQVIPFTEIAQYLKNRSDLSEVFGN